ncbi:UNVERIFIED_CONTAM: hypothetical protein PYX00_006200 [Menopon gallinae]|uniref:POLQ-like helical domain-containing protein n=1 Tax=Menopon gallinae TaxID=328185 RepID=A0AAW2HVB3_9NEOP
MKRVGEMVGVEESFLVRIAKGTLNPNTVENRIKLSIHRRFYTALALQDLVNEVPLTEVAEKYQCNKGTLQSLQQSAATYAGMVTEFTKKLGWGSIELIFSQFQERLQFGVQRDLCELMRLPLLNVIRARALFNAGYKSLVAIANGNASDLENVLYSSIPFQTRKDIAGETSFERIERNRLQTIWITGNADLSVRKAAEILIEQARNALELEMGIEGAQWGNQVQNSQSTGQSGMTDKTVLSVAAKCTGALEEQNITISNSSVVHDNSIIINKEKTENVIASCAKAIPEPCTPQQGNTNQRISTPIEENVRRSLCNISGISSIASKFNSPEISKRNETDYFASSFNIDNIMNFTEVVKKFDKIPEESGKVFKVDESDASSTRSDSPICEKSDTVKSERLSGDMFLLQEAEANDDTLRGSDAKNDEDNESKTLEAPADLFSQSLTFDTQMQRVLEVDEEDKPKIKRNTSFHSDDLGFVSDFSPPKQNQKMRKDASEVGKACPSSAIIKFPDLGAPRSISTPVSTIRKEEDVLNKSHGQSLKRKNCISNSPDFIIGSDDSYVEEGHVSKKPRVVNSRNSRESFESHIQDESDTEILPTPKCNKTTITKSISNVSNKSIAGRKGSLLNSKSLAREEINQRKSYYAQWNKFRNLSNLSARASWDKISIIDVSADNDVFQSFREELKLQNIVGLALGCRRIIRERKSSIGLKIMKKKVEKPKEVTTTLKV